MIFMMRCVIVCMLLGVVPVLRTAFAEEVPMHEDRFQISVAGEPVVFAAPPISKDGKRFVPLEPFAAALGLKVETPAGEDMAVLCGGTASEICVPLRFGDSDNGVAMIEGVHYVEVERVTEPFGFAIYEGDGGRLEIIHPSDFAPDFSLPDLEGVSRSIGEFRGKKTLLYVWGSW